MPELPDLVVYIEALQRHIVGRRLDRVLLLSPFVLRSVDPPLESIVGTVVTAIDRIGKRIVLAFADAASPEAPRALAAGEDRYLVLHLMIAGRLRWRPAGAAKKGPGISPKLVLAAFEFEHGTLFFTEASSRKRASMQMAAGAAAVRALDPGGIEPLDATLDGVQRRADARESHREAGADRSASVQRHRQRLLRRDPSRRQALAAQADAVADR